MILLNGVKEGEKRFIICIDSFSEYKMLDSKKEFIEDDELVNLYKTLEEAEKDLYSVAIPKNYKDLKIQKLVSDGTITIYSDEYWLKKHAYITFSDGVETVTKEYDIRDMFA